MPPYAMVAEILPHPSWFDLRKYAGTDRLDFEGWRTQIGNRIFLGKLLSAKFYAEFDNHFATIRNHPFYDLGFSDSYASDKAVFPLPFGIAEAMVLSLAPHSPRSRDNCDQKLLDIGEEGFEIHGHIVVDFSASEKEIIAAFQEWLTPALGASRKKQPRIKKPGISDHDIASWHSHRLLAFKDLSLWYRRQEQKMPANPNIAVWMYTDQLGTEAKVRAATTLADNVFTINTLRQLSLAASQTIIL